MKFEGRLILDCTLGFLIILFFLFRNFLERNQSTNLKDTFFLISTNPTLSIIFNELPLVPNDPVQPSSISTTHVLTIFQNSISFIKYILSKEKSLIST